MNFNYKPIGITLMYNRKNTSEQIKTILHQGITFDSNLCLWLQQLNLIKGRDQRYECLRSKKYCVEINDKKVESFSENEGLLKHGATVVIKENDNQKKQARSRFVKEKKFEEDSFDDLKVGRKREKKVKDKKQRRSTRATKKIDYRNMY